MRAQSARSVTLGSTPAPLKAGTALARSDIPSTNRLVATNVTGSVALTLKSEVARSRVLLKDDFNAHGALLLVAVSDTCRVLHIRHSSGWKQIGIGGGFSVGKGNLGVEDPVGIHVDAPRLVRNCRPRRPTVVGRNLQDYMLLKWNPDVRVPAGQRDHPRRLKRRDVAGTGPRDASDNRRLAHAMGHRT